MVVKCLQYLQFEHLLIHLQMPIEVLSNFNDLMIGALNGGIARRPTQTIQKHLQLDGDN